MSDQDNLRDRIADAIYKNQDTAVGYASELFGDAAQAVIDEFGLRWEHQPVIGGTRKRIIGDWGNGEKREVKK